MALATTFDNVAPRPLVSVVIPTRDRAHLVGVAIESVLAASDDGSDPDNAFDLEIVVVDDGSVDNTKAVLADYPVTVVDGPAQGQRPARNAGYAAADGQFIQFLDDDDCLTPESIGDLLRTFREHPEYAMVHGRAQLTDMSLEPYGEPLPRGERESGWILEDLLRYFPQMGTILTRREAIDHLGGFSDRWVDDWEIALRAAKEWPIGRIDTVAVLFRQRDTAEEDRQWRATRDKADIFSTMTAHLPLVQRLRLRPIFWRQRGWHASIFVGYAMINWENGEWRRVRRSLVYAARWSPVHTPVLVATAVLAKIRG